MTLAWKGGVTRSGGGGGGMDPLLELEDEPDVSDPLLGGGGGVPELELSDIFLCYFGYFTCFTLNP